MPSVSEADFNALHTSFRDLARKIQIPISVPTQHDRYPAHSANENSDEPLSARVARLSVDQKILGSSDDKRSEDGQGPGNDEDQGTQAVQPGIRLQGSLDLSADESENDGDQETDDSVGVEIKEEKDDERGAIAPPDPAIFEITTYAADHQLGFFIKFNDERVIKGLYHMPVSEIWQLILDAINHDPDIPTRTPTLPWITNVKLLADKSLAIQTKSKEDLATVTANAEWARNIRDIISASIKTYKVVLLNVKIRYRETASIINKLRKENYKRIAALNQIGTIRDVVILQDPTSKMGNRNEVVDYLLVFGSREAANAALDMGMLFRNKRRACVAYSLGPQWHYQCSYCQKHDHAARDCHSTPVCGKCTYKHATHYCTSATTRCANCHGEHWASSKKCPKWLEAEDNARRSYRFPTEESEPQPSGTSALPTQTITTSILQNSQKTLDKSAKMLPSPIVSQISQDPSNEPPKVAATTPDQTLTACKSTPTTTAINPTHETNPSPTTNAPPTSTTALLSTIDAFRAFVVARENPPTQPPKQSKRKRERKTEESDYLMSGALQADGHKEKRMKREREEEGPVWPIGQADYRPPSLNESTRVRTSGKVAKGGRSGL